MAIFNKGPCMMYESRRIQFLFFSLGLVCLLFCGCAKKSAETAGGRIPGSMRSSAVSVDSILERADMELAEAPEPEAVPVARDEVARERMIHYDGFMHLRTPRPVEVVDEATRIVEDAGGYVEQLDGERAVFRVPVAEFQTVFDRLLDLGDVLDRSVTAEDVTDAFMDADLRLKIARATHQRLVELLAKAREEKEKIRILREIQRIRTEIETLSAQRDRLLSMARFSRITLLIEARKLDGSTSRQESIAAFEWISRLSPFDDQVARSGRPLKFDVPEGMVGLDRKGLWAAESADGAVMRASRHDLQPVGDTDFWMEAVRLRLGPEYADARVVEKGDFKLLRLEDRSETPCIYLVGLHVNRSRALEVVEVYYPTSAHENRYSEQVFTSIARGAK
jgi:hypothetical protein